MKTWIIVLGLLVMTIQAQARERLIFRGSDTLGALLIPQLAAAYSESHPGVSVEIAAEGSSTGILSLLTGDASVAMSSRRLKSEEEAFAREAGIQIRQIPIATDAILIAVHPRNPLKEISLVEAEMVFAGDVRYWWQDPVEGKFIYVYTRHSASGTFSRFKELAMRGRDYSPTSQKLAGNEQIAYEISMNPHSIGFVSLVQANAEGIKVLPVEGVPASFGAIRSGDYPLQRQLYLVVREPAEPTVSRFLGFVRSSTGQKIIRLAGFLPVE